MGLLPFYQSGTDRCPKCGHVWSSADITLLTPGYALWKCPTGDCIQPTQPLTHVPPRDRATQSLPGLPTPER
jgi:hypothetical protein